MRKFMRYATVPMSIAALSACADQSAGPTGPEGRINLSVAPLSLPGITGATKYTITVKRGTETVWSESNLDSSTYGDGNGAITYIGTCDATDPTNTVELVLNELHVDGVAGALSDPDDFVNPCDPGECVQTIDCVENTDSFVEFNLAIMRSANQGFFDIAVNFEDVFCSAKLDCAEELLHGADDVRGKTVIVALACSAGAGQDTNMYLDDITIGTQTFDVAGDEGNRTNDDGTKYAVYRDVEELAGVGEKAFWNIAINVDGDDSTIDTDDLVGQVQTIASASNGAFQTSSVLGGFMSPNFTKYPYIRYDFPLSTGACFPEQKLDAAGASGGVFTEYTSLSASVNFDHRGEVASGSVTVTEALPAL